MAFEDGLRFGADAFQQGINNARQRKIDERTEQEFAWRTEDRARQQRQIADEDAAFAGIDSAEKRRVLARAPQATGLRLPGGPVPDAVDPAALGAEGGSAAPAGLRPQPAPANFGVGSAEDSDVGLTKAYRGVARAKRDVKGMQDFDAQIRRLEFERDKTAAYKAFDAMSDEELAAAVKKASDDAAIPGHGTWQSGKGKEAGYMHYLPPDGAPLTLSKAEARDVFMAKSLMDRYGSEARMHLENTTDKVRAVVSQIAKDTRENANVSNTGVHNMNQDATARFAAESLDAYHRRMTGIAAAKANREARGNPVQLVNEKGDAALFYDGEFRRGPGGMVQLPPGWQFPKQRAEVEVLKGPDGNPTVALNARTKTPLFSYGPGGTKLPPGGDPWMTKEGKDAASTWASQRVSRVLYENDDGSLSYKYADADNPDGVMADKPEDVVAMRQRAAQAVKERTRPAAAPTAAAPARGLPAPSASATPSDWDRPGWEVARDRLRSGRPLLDIQAPTYPGR